MYCVNNGKHHFNSDKDSTPQFFGYCNKPEYLLDNTYEKWKFSLFKPWRNSTNELKGEYNSFITALEEYMYDNKFPVRILGDILRGKRCKCGLGDYPEGSNFVSGDNDAIPTSQCGNIDFEKIIEAVLLPTKHANEEKNDFDDIPEAFYDRLHNRPLKGHDWYVGYREYDEDALTDFSKQYHESRNQAIIDISVQEIKLFDEMLYFPENCRADAQIFLVYHHIFMNYKMILHQIG